MKYIDLFAGIGGFHYGIDKAIRGKLEDIELEGINTGRKIKTNFEGSKKSNEERKKINGISGICQEKEKRIRKESQEGLRSKKNDLSDERATGMGGGITDLQQHTIKSGDRQFTCVYSNEWDKYANSVYRRHYEKCDNRDIRTVEAGEIPDHDLLVGGFPCQAFSIAGKRGGFDDTRGTLFFEIARILKEKQPRLCVLENVKGLLSHDNGRTIKIILTTLTELGYDLQWQVLNSKNFGVPQNRERVFIIGHIRGTPRPQVFPLQTTVSTNLASTTIDANYWKGIDNHGARTGISYSQKEWDKSNNPNNIRRATYTDDMRIRRLTPIECERLQGFPDDWTKYGADGELISDTQRYKMCGNAVTTNVITEIIKHI